MVPKGSANIDRVKSIFLAAIEIPSWEQREAYLNRECENDTELRKRVEALLLAHEEAGGFLKPSILGANITPQQSTLIEQPGSVIDRYKLLEKIGEGDGRCLHG
jgi:hypothetical protein